MNTRTSRLKHSFNVAFDAVSVCVTISVLNTNLRKCQAEISSPFDMVLKGES